MWSLPAAELLRRQAASRDGLSRAEAALRLRQYGPNLPRRPERYPALRLLLRQLRSPITLLLLATTLLSAFAGETTDALIILVILLGSTGLGFWQENRTAGAIAGLFALIRLRARVWRDGALADLPVEDLVPGDVLALKAGDLVPADCRLLEASSLNVDESTFTGESFPAVKGVDPVAADSAVSARSCALFQGTHVVSGTARALVVATGARTEYGALAGKLEQARGDSEFERGVTRFGYLLLEITAALALTICAANIALQRPLLEVFMFTLALAVGLTPQLLPAIVSVTLAHGARRMAAKQVLVRRLVAMEEFGAMTVLCTDKTGTLTEGVVRLRESRAADGAPSDSPLRLAWLNASLQSGFDNPLDAALCQSPPADPPVAEKLAELPYDFVRRRLSVVVRESTGSMRLITKGALDEVLSVCTQARGADGITCGIEERRAAIQAQAQSAFTSGLRCIAVASRAVASAGSLTVADESAMVFEGLLTFADPPKPGIRETIAALAGLGVGVKIITGDNRLVAAAIAQEAGLGYARVLTGGAIGRLSESALRARAGGTDIFAEVDPNQKERIILALRRGGFATGYLGDGINDAAALRAADIGISVDNAAEVSREAADIVLLRKDLAVLAEGIVEGRRAFANTLKYIFVTTSANFGNMLSLAGASLLAAFLPLLPKQVLLLNLLSDLPAMAIATDRLDPEQLARPRRWDLRYIRDFMIVFGLLSSCFDFLTFGLLLWLHSPAAQFRTAWFIESNLTEIFVLLAIRTTRPFYRSAPSRPLLWATLAVGILTLALPFLPGTALLGFGPLPPGLLLGVLGIAGGLVLASELAKRSFFRSHSPSRPAA